MDCREDDIVVSKSDGDDFDMKGHSQLFGTSEDVDEAELELVDRPLDPGNIVEKAGVGGQKGKVLSIVKTCDLQGLVHPVSITGVNSSDLLTFLPFYLSKVYLEGWIGNVDEISKTIVIKFSDGASCKLSSKRSISNFEKFKDIHHERDKPFAGSFYEGQSLSGRYSLFDGCEWLVQTEMYSSETLETKGNETIVVSIYKLDIISVEVMWLCRGYSKASLGDDSNSRPPTFLSGEDLKRLKILNCFEASDYDIESTAYYQPTDNDINRSRENEDNNKNELSNFVGKKIPMKVIAIQSNAKVLWQDNTTTDNTSSRDLKYCCQPAIFPGDYVSRALPSENHSINDYGVIQKVNHVEKTCIVQWYSDDGRSASSTLGEKQELNVTDIKEHSNLKFKLGDVVVRVGGFVDDLESESGASAAVGGQVLELGVDGSLLVHWADGDESYCKPGHLFNITSEAKKFTCCFLMMKLTEMESSEDESDYTDTEGTGSDSTGRQTYINGLNVHELEKNVNVFASLRETMSQHLVTVDSIQCRDKSKIKFTFSSSTVDLSVKRKFSYFMNELIRIGSQESTKQDHDKFSIVVQKIAHTFLAMKKLNKDFFISAWLGMTGYLKPVLCVLRRLNCHDLCDEIHAKSREFFERNIKCVKSQTGEKDEEEEATTTKSHSPKAEIDDYDFDHFAFYITFLFQAFNSIYPVNSLEDLIRAFRSFIKKLFYEFNECQELCQKSLEVKQRFRDVPFGDVLFGDANVCMNDNVNKDFEEDNSTESFKDTVEVGLREDVVTSCADNDVHRASQPKLDTVGKGFIMLDTLPDSHHFKKNNFSPINPKTFISAIRKETNLLKTCLPEGIHVRGFKSRMDLFSVMIEGPKDTPYEGGLFFLDVQLAPDHPNSPPHLYYVSRCSGTLNPNLHGDGEISGDRFPGIGKMWDSRTSDLVQVFVSIREWVLNKDPYYNNHEKRKGCPFELEKCRKYNEKVIIKLVEEMEKLVLNPHDVFKEEIITRARQRVDLWKSMMEPTEPPGFPLTPTSDEFRNCLRENLDRLEAAISGKNVPQ